MAHRGLRCCGTTPPNPTLYPRKRLEMKTKLQEQDLTKGMDLTTEAIALCPACGAHTHGAKFCPECGKPIQESIGHDRITPPWEQAPRKSLG